jgi:hypothetical protein
MAFPARKSTADAAAAGARSVFGAGPASRLVGNLSHDFGMAEFAPFVVKLGSSLSSPNSSFN